MSRKYFSLTEEVSRPTIAAAMPADQRNGTLLDPRRVLRLSGVSHYLGVSPAVARVILMERHITPRVGGYFDLRDLWLSLWGISQVPDNQLVAMCAPTMTVAQVAELAGVSERTIRRAGDSRSPIWALPRHVDLGPRLRRYLRPLVEAWAMQIPSEPWLTPAPRRSILGGAVLLNSRAGAQSTTNGQTTNHPPK